jgi:hypothetical protein
MAIWKLSSWYVFLFIWFIIDQLRLCRLYRTCVNAYVYIFVTTDTDCFDQCCGFGSGIRCLFDWIGDPEKVLSGSQISDPASQNHIFESLLTIFLGKKLYNSLIIGPDFFLQHFKNKTIFNFVKFVATKKGMTTTPLFCCCFWIRDPIQDPGWVKIRIRDKHPGSATLALILLWYK